MNLDKFPITTNRHEYRVSIKESDLRFYDYAVRVYIKKGGLFRKWWCVSKQYIDTDHFTDPTFINFAKRAVNNYESELDAEIRERNHQKEMESEWNNWDGDMR